MKKINANFLFPLIALFILIFGLSQRMFTLPPMGKLLNPFMGAIRNESDNTLQAQSIVINDPGLIDTVSVYLDTRKVPHIFAANEEDLYFAQGYVAASFRLWQMDFMTYIAAGRLAELYNELLLDNDRQTRRLGILDAAKASLQLMEQDPLTSKILSAYTKGVNAFIGQLEYKDLPFEYKLMDYTPEPWSNLKTVLILKQMANSLSGYEEDYTMSNLMLALGEERFNSLFPEFISPVTPVMQDSTTPSGNFVRNIKKPDYLDFSFLSPGAVIAPSSYNPKLGSNSWVVSGQKTVSGYPILCNDPHLGLTLPAVWIEMQLTMPGMNVYGVSIPGTPAIIIGFNQNIAWGLTNGADDVKDWYKLKISSDYRKYELDGNWLPLKYSVEQIKVRNQKTFYDTIYRTIHGPVVYDNNYSKANAALKNYALKWQLHQPSNEFLTFIELNKAKNYKDFRKALVHYACPVQNFTFACKDNTIAVNHQGLLAVKKQGQGKFVLDGTQSTQLYNTYIPADSLPQVANPSSGYVLSANQHPTSPGYPYYYNGYFSETRAKRIQQALEKNTRFDIRMMQDLQLDNINSFAVDVLPALINLLDTSKFGYYEKTILANLKKWNGAFDSEAKSPRFFELWWKNIKNYTWDEFKTFSFAARMPEDYVLLDLLQNDPANVYFDLQGTFLKETAADLVKEAFHVAVSDYRHFEWTTGVRWSYGNQVNLLHLTKIEAFSRMGLSSSGHPEAINAIRSTWGPSWRMVVQLGERPQAFGIYAGGQSGNMGSPYYDNFIGDWNKGKYYSLNFYLSENEANKHTK